MEREAILLQALKPLVIGILFSCLFPFSSSNSFGEIPSTSPQNDFHQRAGFVPKLILISFDGFRPDYIDPANTPNLYALRTDGVFSKRMKSAFTTKTYPNHMSITTGLYEESHGVVHNKMFDPLFNQTFNEFNTDPKWWFNNKSIPIWIANEKENDGKARYSASMMWPGTDVKFKGKLATYVEAYKPKANFTRNVDVMISWLSDPKRPANLVLAYFDEPDTQSHLTGPFSSQVMHQVRNLDSVVGYLIMKLKQLKLYHEINLIILSDHGMSEITDLRVIALNDFIPRDYYRMYGASPIWNIIPKEGLEGKVYEILHNESKRRNYTVFRKDQVPYEYHYSNHRRILPIVLVADDGFDVTDSIDNLDAERNHHTWGNHGYNNSLASMRPLFIASGPSFKSHIEIEEDFNNIDTYPLMSVILELFPLNQFPSNGSLKIVSSMLKPIVRAAKSESVFPFMSLFALTFVGVSALGACFVIANGLGKSRKPPINIHWESGVTEFDFGEDDNSEGRKIPSTRILNFPQNAGYSSVSEAVLLLDDLGDEEEDGII